MTYKTRGTGILLSVASMAWVLSGCSGSGGGDGDGPASSSPSSALPSSLASAARVCNGLFEKAGSSSLQELLQGKEFSTDVGGVKVESVEQAADAMSAETADDTSAHHLTAHRLCSTQRADRNPSRTLLVSAGWYRLKSADLQWRSDDDSTVYDLADSGRQTYATPYANATDTSSIVYFRCPVGLGKKHDVVARVTAETGSTPPADTKARREQLTRIGAAAAGQLAKSMGCTEESRLPVAPDLSGAVPRS
ncbi:hypothetical protein [Streptomyces sp. VRA16 Mangrove soil]|uniref:hypothetical protein n=1 Tax=Streptomyces sp. VRA16 Mangrove soil TaxID=2817434 RepID=UPI001A9E6E26|nr:hypothetical protein [Streptomyces sp. VRA16 Mangrove soil]MBO1336040.1 hypothetical protein [Streptomyces sp. VRA16 Mangrove soil]